MSLWLSGWSYRVKLTSDSGVIDTDLTNFPSLLYVSASSGKNTKDLSFVFDEVGANSKKIAVTKSDGTTECYVEIETWDLANEKASLWAKHPTLNGTTNEDYYLYFDNTHADNTTYVGNVGSAPAQAVWDNNFKAVYHMKDDPDISNIKDSTSNSHNGVKKAANEPIEIDGKVGKAQDFDGSNDYINIASSTDFAMGTEDFSTELWVKFDTVTPVAQWLYGGNEDNNFDLAWYNTNKLYVFYQSGIIYTTFNFTPSMGVWYHIATTRNGTNMKMFVNGAQIDVTKTLNPNISTTGLYMGIQFNAALPFNGIEDEFRISKGIARSASWIKASYNSENDSLWTWGDIETTTELTETLSLVDTLSISCILPLTIGTPNTKIVISELGGATIYEITEDVDEVRIEDQGGLSSKSYSATIENRDNQYPLIERGNQIDIYLGYAGDYTKVLSGFVYDIHQSEDTLVLTGSDWSDYLQGPSVTMGYINYTAGRVIRDLIDGIDSGTGYAEQLDSSTVIDTTYTYDGWVNWDNIALSKCLQDILNKVYIETSAKYRLRVDNDKKVWLDLQSNASSYLIDEEDVIGGSISSKDSRIITRVRVIGGKEIVVDDLSGSYSETCNTWFQDWFFKLSGGDFTRTLSSGDYFLRYSNASAGLAIAKIGMSRNTGVYTGIHLKHVEINMRQTGGSTVNQTIYFNRTNTSSWTDGYKLVLNNGYLTLSIPSGTLREINLYSTEEPTLGDWFVINFIKSGNSIKCGINDKIYISINDNTYDTGTLFVSPPAGVGITTDYTFFYIETTDNVNQYAEDTALKNKYGIKELPLRKPEVRLNYQAYQWALGELNKKKLSQTSGNIEIDGTVALETGDIITLTLDDWNIDEIDYQISGITQSYKNSEWTTKLELEEYSSEIASVLAQLAELGRATPPTLYTPVTFLIEKPRASTILVVCADSSIEQREQAHFLVPSGSTTAETWINAALNALPSGGGTVRLAEGTYIIDGQITIPVSNITIEGSGSSSIIKLKDAFNSNLILLYVSGVSNVTIQNMKIDANKANQSSGETYGIKVLEGSNIKIIGCEVNNSRLRSGIYITSTEGEISSNLLVNNGGYGIYSVDSTRLNVTRNIVTSNFGGIYIYGTTSTENCIITGNICRLSAGSGLLLYHLKNSSVNNNICNDNGDQGSNINSSNSNITGNVFNSNNGHGCALAGDENNVSNNDFSFNSKGADGTSTGLWSVSGTGNNIQNNKARKGTYSNLQYQGILNTATLSLLSNNDCYTGGKTYGLYDGGTNTSFGAGNRKNDGTWGTGSG